MAKDFIQELENAYVVTTQLMISDSNKPTDMRQTCGTVADFETFKEQTGMELRYPGLITYEIDTKLYKGCFTNSEGNLDWAVLNIGFTPAEVSQMKQDLNDIKTLVDKFDIQFIEEAKLKNGGQTDIR